MTRRKPPSRRQRAATNDLAVLPASGVDVPAPPDYLKPALKSDWSDLWSSPIAAAWDPVTDYKCASRLFSLYDLRDDAEATLREDGLLVSGSRGQITDHPMARRISDMDTELRQLEDRLGLNPKARLALGLDGLRARRVLTELGNNVKSDDPADDPRLKVVE